MWAKWQAKDPSVRLTEIGGNNRPLPLSGPIPGPGTGPGGPGFPPPFGDPQDNIRPADVP